MRKGTRKQFCVHGHDTFVCGRTKQRVCKDCMTDIQKSNYKYRSYLMALKKFGSAQTLKVVKNAAFAVDVNSLAERFLKDWPNKKITIDQIHNSLKSIGIVNYSSEDMSVLTSRLQAIGFSIQK